MNINITGNHIEITPAIKEMTLKKFERIQAHFDHITSAHIIFTANKLAYTVETTLHVPGESMCAKAEAKDMYKALDDMLERLDRQIKKHKEKQKDHHRGERGE
jgi:putative sigma-54 modulation protein